MDSRGGFGRPAVLPMLRTLLVTALALLAFAAPAAAHPTLLQAAPSPGLALPNAPQRLTLAFSEPPVARGSRLSLTDPRGHRVATGRLSTVGDSLTASVRDALRPGVYDVRWTVLGDDGHTSSGRFRFGV